MSEISLEMLTFEQALAELEGIVRELENGQIGLEESLAHYEKGVTLLKRCYGQLQQAEQRIVLLRGLDSDNQPITQPFETAPAPSENNNIQGRIKKTNNGNDLF
jgi:exodeoxyribonuclease VII small subunit